METTDGGNSLDELGLLADELLRRRRNGENPTIQEYLDRRPDLADAIQNLFPTLLFVESVACETPGQAVSPIPSDATLRSDQEHPSSVSLDNWCAGLRQVGEYRILREIGRGGMGIVVEAEQASLDRRVALKILPFHALLGSKRLERFHHEARAAGRLSHPNIVSIHGIGEHLGLHYFVMQLIDGKGLDDVLQEVRELRKDPAASAGAQTFGGLLSRGDRSVYHKDVARIVRDAARALQHAHAHGVLHRDVKPSNLLLDVRGHVWLADFGLAKSADSEELTRSGDCIGTLRYMAPERFAGWSDPRSDVYALGLTLYELLCLRPAFEEQDRQRLIHRVVSEGAMPLRMIDRSIPEPLETIVLKASDREPAHRYAGAREMADDLERYLNGEPLAARRTTRLGKVVRWCACNPVVAALSSTVLLLLIAVAVVSTSYAVRLTSEQKSGREKLRASYLEQARALRLSGGAGQRFGAISAVAMAAQIRPGQDLCNEVAAVVGLEDSRKLDTFEKGAARESVADLDHGRVALAYSGGEVLVRSLDGIELWRTPSPGGPFHYVHPWFHPDGRYLCVRYYQQGREETARWSVWDLELKKETARVNDPESVDGIDSDPRDGSLLVAARGGVLRAVVPSSGHTLSELRFPFEVGDLSAHPRGQLVAISRHGAGKELFVVERSSGNILRTMRLPDRPAGLAWHPEGHLLAVACHDFNIYVWEAQRGVLRWTGLSHEAEAIKVKFGLQGDLLASESWDNQVQFWDSWSGRKLYSLHGSHVYLGHTSPALAIEAKSSCEIHELSPRREAYTLFGHEQPGTKQPHGVVLFPGRGLAASQGDDGVSLWDLRRRTQVGRLPTGWTHMMKLDLPGENLYTAGFAGFSRWPLRVDQAQGRVRFVCGPPRALLASRILRAAMSDDCRVAALVSEGGKCQSLALDDSAQCMDLESVPGIDKVAVSPDGNWIAGGSIPLRRVVVWSRSNAKVAKRPDVPFGNVQFDPSGRYLAVGAPLEYVILETSDWSVACRLGRKSGLPFPAPLGFDRSGSILAVALTDYGVSLYNIDQGKDLAELRVQDPKIINGIALDLEGGVLAASSGAHRVFVWNLEGVERQLSASGLDWELPRQLQSRSQSLPLDVQVLENGEALGTVPPLDDPRSPSLFQRYWNAPYLPSLDSFQGVDLALQAPRFLVPEGSTWRFFRGTKEPSPSLEWTEPGFDDARWEQGPSGFGGGERKEDIGTLLADQLYAYPSVYIRSIFDLPEWSRVARCYLSIRFEDGFVAYLNGQEIARSSAGIAGERLDCQAFATRSDVVARKELIVPVEPSSLRAGRNVLAVQAVTYALDSRVFVQPVLAASLEPDLTHDRECTAVILRNSAGVPVPVLSDYREGRILQRAQRYLEAARLFERIVALEPSSPEPLLRLIECHELLGAAGRAEWIARAALEGGVLIEECGVRVAWQRTMVHALRQPLSRVLSSWPEPSPVQVAESGATRRAVLTELVASGVLRLNCGGPALAPDSDGKAWGADAFYLGGSPQRLLAEENSGSPCSRAEDGEVGHTLRSFDGSRQLRPAYSLPLVPGRYCVKLLFASPGSSASTGPRFSVLLEGQTVLGDYQPPRQSSRCFEVRSFALECRDGFLDIDFLAEVGQPVLAGIEVEWEDN